MGLVHAHSERILELRQCDGLCLPAPSLVQFSRGLTFSTPAAAFSGMLHIPPFSQQEKRQWVAEREQRRGVVREHKKGAKNAGIIPAFLCCCFQQSYCILRSWILRLPRHIQWTVRLRKTEKPKAARLSKSDVEALHGVRVPVCLMVRLRK